jgi:DNA invertase Pin-like site-specific DNA recombinase
MLLGYARTSTADQHAGLEAQERDLRAAGAEKVWSEQVSSVTHRDQLQALLGFAREGDTIIVTKPDRLARSTAELLAIEADLTRHGIGLVVLSMGGAKLDTRNPTSKLMLTILAGVATWEREIMLERQREGIARARAEGKYRGRARTVAKQAAQIRAMVAAGEKPAHVARKLKVARSSVYRVMGSVTGPVAGKITPRIRQSTAVRDGQPPSKSGADECFR